MRTMCTKCKRKRSYTNPIVKCYECGKRFCFDHIFGGQVNRAMKEINPIRDTCIDCKKMYGYFHVSEW